MTPKLDSPLFSLLTSILFLIPNFCALPSLTPVKPLGFPTCYRYVLESLLKSLTQAPPASPAVPLKEQPNAILHFSAFATSHTKSCLPQVTYQFPSGRSTKCSSEASE